jgi:hypothetical protein
VRKRTLLFGILIAVLVSPASMPAVLDSSLALMAQLHEKLQQVRLMLPGKSIDPARVSLVPLVGLDRRQVTSGLGQPDYCGAAGDNGCASSTHWTYFFYPWKPTSRETSSGTVELTAPIIGWALELRFAQSGVIETAQWVKQE